MGVHSPSASERKFSLPLARSQKFPPFPSPSPSPSIPSLPLSLSHFSSLSPNPASESGRTMWAPPARHWNRCILSENLTPGENNFWRSRRTVLTSPVFGKTLTPKIYSGAFAPTYACIRVYRRCCRCKQQTRCACRDGAGYKTERDRRSSTPCINSCSTTQHDWSLPIIAASVARKLLPLQCSDDGKIGICSTFVFTCLCFLPSCLHTCSRVARYSRDVINRSLLSSAN